jgi:hypothetical protein
MVWVTLPSPFVTDPAQMGAPVASTAMAARFKSSSTGVLFERANHIAC